MSADSIPAIKDRLTKRIEAQSGSFDMASVINDVSALLAELSRLEGENERLSDPRFLQSGYEAQAAHVVEELDEFLADAGPLLAALGKTGRWGLDSTDPTIPPEQRETNRAWVRRALAKAKTELPDVIKAIERLEVTMDASDPRKGDPLSLNTIKEGR